MIIDLFDLRIILPGGIFILFLLLFFITRTSKRKPNVRQRVKQTAETRLVNALHLPKGEFLDIVEAVYNGYYQKLQLIEELEKDEKLEKL